MYFILVLCFYYYVTLRAYFPPRFNITRTMSFHLRDCYL